MQPGRKHLDRDTFAGLIREHQAMVYSIARQFLRQEAVAEELAQEIFLDLYDHWDELQSPAHVTNWLRQVTTRRCIDYSRRWSNRPKLSLEEVPEPPAGEDPADPFLRRAISRLMDSLPEKQRLVVILRYQEDLDPADIASALGMPLNTVKSYLQRSLAMLREKMERMRIRS